MPTHSIRAERLLLSCIGKRCYIADYFREALGGRGTVIGTSNTEWTPGFSSCDASFVLPDIASDEYIPALLDLCRREEITGILSLFDPDVHRLAGHREEFAALGAVPVFPAAEAAQLGYDKLLKWRELPARGFKVPFTVSSLADMRQALAEGMLEFPLVLKPRYGFGSADTYVTQDLQEAEVFFRRRPHMIAQQMVQGEALNIDGLGNLHAEPLGVVPWRKHLSRLGETERAEAIHDEELVALGEQLIRTVGITGPFDADFIRDDHGHDWLIDLNLRFGGGYPVSHLAGADFPGRILRMIQGERAVMQPFGYRAGVTMMKRLEVIAGPSV